MFPGAMNWTTPEVTIELGTLVDSGVNIWAFDYPSYYKGDEKKAFEQKVIDHYRFRQIGQETPGRWLHYFRTRMREIMPYYIQLYESQALMQGLDDPFGNVNVTETFEQTSTGRREGTFNRTTSGSSTVSANESENTSDRTTGEHTKKFSNTPQGALSNLDNYLTEATIENDTNTNTHTREAESGSTATDTGTQGDESLDTEEGTVRHTFTKRGNQGVNTYAHDMKELRETFLNIDLQVIRELNDLFLMVY